MRLAIRAQVAPGPGERAVGISVFYYRQDEERIDLPATPAAVNVPRGETATQEITVDITECLSDPERVSGESEDGCRFHIELALFDEDGEFISGDTQEAEATQPGEEVNLEPFNLPQASVGVSTDAVNFEATVSDEGRPPAKTFSVFSTTGADLGDVMPQVIYPGEGEPLVWLDLAFEGGVVTLRPSTTDLSPGTYEAIVRVVASREEAASADVVVTYTVHALPGGGDLVMFGDGNLLDATGMENADNQRFAANLVGYTTSGSRGAATRVLIDCRMSWSSYLCPNELGPFSNALAAVGFSTTVITSARGDHTSIPADVKLLVFVAPCEGFTSSELVALRAFAAEGGRILMVSEYQSYYGTSWQQCAGAQNQLAFGLGTSMSFAGGDHDIFYNTLPAESLRPHQITTGMSSLTFGYSSRVATDTSARPLFFNMANQVLLGAVETIDTGPLPDVVVESIASMQRTAQRQTVRPTTPLSGTGR